MLSTNFILFFLAIFVTHIMHGVTGFAGTVLAMPFGLMLVGYTSAKPILNVLGMASGIYVFLGNRKYVDWKELRKIVVIMGCGILLGILIKDQLLGKEKMLYFVLGAFVICVSVHGLYKELIAGRVRNKEGDKTNEAAFTGDVKEDDVASESSGRESFKDRLLYLLLPIAGIVHGIFVSGGPLLISYMTKKLPDKNRFRTTISTVWIFLNGMVLVDDIRSGYWNISLIISALVAAPFLFSGLKIGSILYKRMSQRTFMIMSYVLLLVMGVKLLL
ncbi:sulfite exporter TauE/SafE family protein [Oribacterium sp. P6A1]|uniref:sulfite exporter TauE/SafE family protein n=1 Tax=Oribacterium sp. P6A1 TaxID=1410612 RepID=UPI00056CCB0B|nr:sulfite exporter TauE/SafE family protein [Oribacterium sp. P6A1]